MKRQILFLVLLVLVFWPVPMHAGETIFVPKHANGIWSEWTPVFTGFSVDPTINVARFTQIGNLVTARINMGNGTSDATTFTVTLPVAAHASGIQNFSVDQVTDDGTVRSTPGFLKTRVGSTIADVFLSSSSGAWVASGSKKAQFTITYEAKPE
jgi:hypothetical protein